MKRNNIFLTTILAISILSGGCNKFLERPPEGQLTKEEAIKDEQSLVSFTNGIYTLVGDFDFMGGRYQVLNELLGDQFKGDKFTGDFAEIFKRQNTYFGGTRDDFYKKAYAIINRSNIVLDNISLASTQKNSLEGQAKFFRGMVHFELVRMFAQPYGFTADNSQPGIPLRTTANIETASRASVSEVYAQVIADLKDAERLLPADAAGGKFVSATQWAAKAYLAKVYFQMNNFAEAFNYANQVIASGKFQLDTDYNDRFSLNSATGYTSSKEGILVIKNEGTLYTPGGELRSNFRSDLPTPPAFHLTDQFYVFANQKANDKRKVWYSKTLQAGLNTLTKFNKNFFDIPVVHLTEIKLIRAEAGAEMGGANLATALTDINDILIRAYGAAAALPATASAATIIATARNERELEMVGEANRVNEIKRIGARSGMNVDRRKSPWNCPGFILQFPKAELDANASFQLNPEGNCF